MARVKSKVYTKAAVKAPRKQSILKKDSSKTPKDGKSNKYAGGHSTPAWQKPITMFFKKNLSLDDATNKDISEMDVDACSSASSSQPVPCYSPEDSRLFESGEDPGSNVDVDVDADDEESVSDASTMLKHNKKKKIFTKIPTVRDSDDSSM